MNYAAGFVSGMNCAARFVSGMNYAVRFVYGMNYAEVFFSGMNNAARFVSGMNYTEVFYGKWQAFKWALFVLLFLLSPTFFLSSFCFLQKAILSHFFFFWKGYHAIK